MSREFWASAYPSEQRWRLFVNFTSDGERITVGTWDIPTMWCVLGDVDFRLSALGFDRTTIWEEGSSGGFVAWLEPCPDRWLSELLFSAEEQ